MRRWGLHLRLLQQVRGGGKAEAAMGMAPALAAGGPVQRRKGVRAGRADITEVAARVDGIERASLVSHPGMHGSERFWCRTC